MQAYSLDLRQRVLKAYDEGRWTIRDIAQRFEVGEWWVYKLKRQRRLEGTIAPRKGKVGKPRSLGAKDLKRLHNYVDKHPDAPLEQIHSQLKVPCTVVTIHNTLKRLGYTYKKNSTRQRTRAKRH